MPRRRSAQLLAYDWHDIRLPGQFLGTIPEPHPDKPLRQHRLFAAPDGRIWISRIGHGLLCYDQSRWRFTATIPQAITAFSWFQDRLWMSGLQDTTLTTVQGDEWSSIRLPCAYVNHLTQDRSQRLWVSTSDGLWSTVNGHDWEQTKLPGEHQRIRRVWADDNAGLWVQREGIDRLLWMQDGTFEEVQLPEKFGPPGYYIGIWHDTWQHLWAASIYGVWQSSPDGWKKLADDGRIGGQGLISFPTKILKDREHHLWFSADALFIYFHTVAQGDTFLIRVGSPTAEPGPRCYSVYGTNCIDFDAMGRLWIVSAGGQVGWINVFGEEYSYRDTDQYDFRSEQDGSLELEPWNIAL